MSGRFGYIQGPVLSSELDSYTELLVFLNQTLPLALWQKADTPKAMMVEASS